MFQKYIKKPVVISAVRLTSNNIGQVARTIANQQDLPVNHGIDDIKIFTLEGIMTANIGDWVIRGVAGEFYPCKHDIFQKTYEEFQNQ